MAGGWKRDEDDAAQTEGGGEGPYEELLWGKQQCSPRQPRLPVVWICTFIPSLLLQWKMKTQTLMFQKTRDLGATWRSVILLSRGLRGTASWQVCSRNLTWSSWLRALYIVTICPAFIFPDWLSFNIYITQCSQGRYFLTAALDLRSKTKQKENTWRHLQYKYMLKIAKNKIFILIIYGQNRKYIQYFH